MTEKILLNISETAEVLGLSRATVYNTLLSREDFPVVRLGGSVRVNREKLQQWVDERTGGVRQ